MDNLCARYQDATTMSMQADAYYLDIAHLVDQEIIATWEDEVQAAEGLCQTDIKAIDIYAAQLPDRLAADTSAMASSHATALAIIDQ